VAPDVLSFEDGGFGRNRTFLVLGGKCVGADLKTPRLSISLGIAFWM
jgi:hypothetical protein